MNMLYHHLARVRELEREVARLQRLLDEANERYQTTRALHYTAVQTLAGSQVTTTSDPDGW